MSTSEQIKGSYHNFISYRSCSLFTAGNISVLKPEDSTLNGTLNDVCRSTSNYKEYAVTRLHLISRRPDTRVLAFEGDFLHIRPKEYSVAFANVLKCEVKSEESEIIRLVVQRPEESKHSYDFKAESVAKAREIVGEVRKKMRMDVGGQSE